MILTSLLTVVLATLAAMVSAQVDDTQGPIKFDDTHNVTTIYGTWSSGSKNVQTGPVSVGLWVIGTLQCETHHEPPISCGRALRIQRIRPSFILQLLVSATLCVSSTLGSTA